MFVFQKFFLLPTLTVGENIILPSVFGNGSNIDEQYIRKIAKLLNIEHRMNHLPKELLLSWTPDQLDTMHDVCYWSEIAGKSYDAEVVAVQEMQSNEEVWADWLKQDNAYAVGDRKSMEAGGGKYLNFIAIVLRKK